MLRGFRLRLHSFAMADTDLTPEQQLFRAADLVSASLKGASSATVRSLASYYTKIEPRVAQEPFCVMLAQATMLFHLQMPRLAVADVEPWKQLLRAVLQRIRNESNGDRDVLRHPFVDTVIRGVLLGLRPRTRLGPSMASFTPHSVVTLTTGSFAPFAFLAAGLLEDLPQQLTTDWRESLEALTVCPSSLVALRARQLLVRCFPVDDLNEHRQELRGVLNHKPQVLTSEALNVLFTRLCACVPDPSRASVPDLAMCIALSDIFLVFTSPRRKDFAEQFLYPALRCDALRGMLNVPQTRLHICGLLLSLLSAVSSPNCPYYMCLCALMFPFFEEDRTAAKLVLFLLNQQMPQGAYFVSAMANDKRIPPELFGSIILVLNRSLALGLAKLQGWQDDDIAKLIGTSSSLAYKCLYLMRCVVSSVVEGSSKARAKGIHQVLRAALPEQAISMLGQVTEKAFERLDAAAVVPGVNITHPKTLVAELGMVMHGARVEAAIDELCEFFVQAMARCNRCGVAQGTIAVCPVSTSHHLPGWQDKLRLLTTVAECVVMQRDAAHHLVFKLRAAVSDLEESGALALTLQILRHAKATRSSIYTTILPAFTHLISLLSGDGNEFAQGAGAGRRRGRQGELSIDVTSRLLVFACRVLVLLQANGGGEGGITGLYAKLSGAIFHSVTRVEQLLEAARDDSRRRRNHGDSEPFADAQRLALVLWWASVTLLRNGGDLNVQIPPLPPASTDEVPQIIQQANAHHLLRALQRIHAFSRGCTKLVGVTTYRLVCDFNMSMVSIVDYLLNSQTAGDPTDPSFLEKISMTSAPTTPLWQFIASQLQTSAPFRTSFAVALVQSVACYLRTPGVVLERGVQPKASLFFAAVAQAARQNYPVRRMTLTILCSWLDAKRWTNKTVPTLTAGRVVLVLHTLTDLTIRAMIDERDAGVDQFSPEVLQAVETVRHYAVHVDKIASEAATSEPQFAAVAKAVARVALHCSVDGMEGPEVSLSPRSTRNSVNELPPAAPVNDVVSYSGDSAADDYDEDRNDFDEDSIAPPAPEHALSEIAPSPHPKVGISSTPASKPGGSFGKPDSLPTPTSRQGNLHHEDLPEVIAHSLRAQSRSVTQDRGTMTQQFVDAATGTSPGTGNLQNDQAFDWNTWELLAKQDCRSALLEVDLLLHGVSVADDFEPSHTISSIRDSLASIHSERADPIVEPLGEIHVLGGMSKSLQHVLRLMDNGRGSALAELNQNRAVPGPASQGHHATMHQLMSGGRNTALRDVENLLGGGSTPASAKRPTPRRPLQPQAANVQRDSLRLF